eukprot:TRINITY_DN3432_c0_g2_i7.p7 TRINITY_DN3432_c0_g2~~TRINITY_DN3432_c0_g2_i7.p7  ORF type:complete len:213 (-),score=70.46 TRINITY_DN3432_c0_g2_i7:161-799(-)
MSQYACTSSSAAPMGLRAGVVFFVVGGLLGAALDEVHAYCDILFYRPADIVFLRMAWWVPPEFGAGGLLVYLLQPRVDRLVGIRPAQSKADAAMAVAVFVVLYALSGILPFFGTGDALLSLTLAGIFVTQWFVLDGRLALLVPALVLGCGGVLFENTLVALGLFAYVAPDLLGVRHWIVWIWASAVFAGFAAARATRAAAAQQHQKAEKRGR